MDIQKLYSELILDHNANPRNYGDLENASHQEKGTNPLCGDQIEIFLQIQNHQISNLKFKSIGCALSKASTSMMTEILIKKNINTAFLIAEKFKNNLVHENENSDFFENYPKLKIFESVKKLPSRLKCVLLPWYTLNSLLNKIT